MMIYYGIQQLFDESDFTIIHKQINKYVFYLWPKKNICKMCIQ